MVDPYLTDIFEICDQSTIPIHVLKCREILKNIGNLMRNPQLVDWRLICENFLQLRTFQGTCDFLFCYSISLQTSLTSAAEHFGQNLYQTVKKLMSYKRKYTNCLRPKVPKIVCRLQGCELECSSIC